MNYKKQVHRMTNALCLENFVRQYKVTWEQRKKLFMDGRIINKEFEVMAKIIDERRGELFLITHSHYLNSQEIAKELYESGIRLTTCGDSSWPVLFNLIIDPPLWLWYKGNPPGMLNNLWPVAVVGARKAIPYSKYLCKKVVRRLAELNHPVVSGLALGIDGEAHQACLDAGGITAALLPCGITECYPKKHEKMSQEIINRGFVASEFPPYYPIRKANFHCRNRLISGLSVAIIIIQAGKKSGTMMTARTGAEQGREVYVAPATLEMTAFRGSHQLIEDGATILSSLESLDEIQTYGQALIPSAIKNQIRTQISLDEYSNTRNDVKLNEAGRGNVCEVSPRERRILEIIGHQVLSHETLRALTDVSQKEYFSLLIRLETKGLVKRSTAEVFLTESALCCIY